MLNLYPHNEQAYIKSKSILEVQDRTCIVHATGTGKSLIAAKFIVENPNFKFLFISPTIFIFKEIKKHLKGYKSNIQYRTYPSFLDYDFKSMNDFDFIILDEFHRIGAEEWGKAILNFLDLNPIAKKLGLSATHIRYLDDERNMADEIFNGSIASYLDLGTAIELGIHKVPKYVSALYNVKEIIFKTEERLKEKNKTKELENLKSRKVAWEESTGVDFILKKHLDLSRKKILVFCKTVEHINFVSQLIEPILKQFYNNNIEFNRIFSTLGENKTLSIFSHFEMSNVTQVLYCIDMLNEGIHVKNVDTVMMFRDTISPIIYFQQMGRSFAVGQEQQPLIFDFVNNFNIKNSINSLQQGFYLDFNAFNDEEFYNSRKFIIDFFDETLEFQKFINEFYLFKKWEESYEDLKVFINKNGRLPTKKEMMWWHTQKAAYNNFSLSHERITALESLMPNIFKSVYNSFNVNISELESFINNNKRIPTYKENPWLAEQKKYNKGLLEKEKEMMLRRLSPNIFDSVVKSWDESYEKIVYFNKKNGRLPLHSEKEHYWLRHQKSLYNKGKLNQTQINKIEKLDPNFFQKNILHWNESFLKLKEFFYKHNRLPSQKEMFWLAAQKAAYKKGKLNKMQIEKLLSIDKNIFIFQYHLNESRIKIWNEKFEEFKNYFILNKSLPRIDDNLWFKQQRTLFKKGKLEIFKIEKLKEVCSYVFDDLTTVKWYLNYNELINFISKNKRYPLKIEMDFLFSQKQLYKNKKLSQWKIELLLNIDKNIFN